ncbi:50S ribosomal protein L33 [Anaerobacillus arseniciselenatis]|uniref:Large ribosomal subunit protein bL33 n=1 Tax=Anaerobacillus arseniciselenatis TaxID=85682 RepID=A0A1S2LSX8_9BACI|nr:50S ribosomal protein L33 [Anaerobacillus arseniciselenatis]OIJ15434.1 50S ribosomal protein L33 [Anaerobacillus arseniciselenatis]
MRKKAVLACSICKSRNYTTEKKKSDNEERIGMKMFCKVCNEHTLHLETK